MPLVSNVITCAGSSSSVLPSRSPQRPLPESHLLSSASGTSVRPLASRLFSKEALGEGGDEADLDDEADQRLSGGKLGDRVFQIHAAGEEAAAVERRHAEDE